MALIQQFIRFVGIGFLNTAVDYAVFNFGAAASGIYTGRGVGYIAALSFSVAVIHSYFWNKRWAFAAGTLADGDRDIGIFKNAGQFIAAAAIGAVIIALVIFGSGNKFEYWFYLVVLLVLLLAEMMMWKVFGLAKNPVAGPPAGEAGKTGRDLLLFVIISLIGVVINSQILDKGTTYITPQFGLAQELWTNLIKAGATGVSLVWNFLGYKIFVFKR